MTGRLRREGASEGATGASPTALALFDWLLLCGATRGCRGALTGLVDSVIGPSAEFLGTEPESFATVAAFGSAADGGA